MNTKTTVISQAELDAQFACCDKIAAYWQTKRPYAHRLCRDLWLPAERGRFRKARGAFSAQCGYAIVAAPRARMWSS